MIPKSAVCMLLALSLLFFLPKLGMPLLDPDEGLYATIAHEMVTRGDWVVHHLN
jgi:4-amino-4-deoxy-L-arabinose transferase-like glycosyltransferase